jgi:hypothetical protein
LVRADPGLAVSSMAPAMVRRPMALGFKTDEIQRLLTVGEPGVL